MKFHIKAVILYIFSFKNVGHVKLFHTGQLISRWGKIIYSYTNLDLLH